MTLVQNGVASILFTSEISSKKIESLLTATVTESSNAELKNTTTKRTISLNPNIDDQKDQTVGASLTDVMVETCDRVVLFFNKDVNVLDYTQNTEEEKYAYNSQKMDIKILNNAGTKESIDDDKDKENIKTPMALYPVKDNPKALYAILNTDTKNDYLTDNAKVIVKVTDYTKSIPVTETKSTLVSDIRTPSILDVKQNGLKSIDVIFSEPVQNGDRDNSAEIVKNKDTDKWVIDTRTLSDYSWGDTKDQGKIAEAKVGTFNKKTGVDKRNVVTITLGQKANGDEIYFTAGKHSIQGNKIGDWANVTDPFNNFINTQTLDFTIEADETAPKMDVKVESPEQYYVTFNTGVKLEDLKNNLELQQYKDNKWTKINKINIRKIDSAGKEYIVELKEDWTDILETKTSKKNYYNYNFRLHMDEKKVTNLLNGLKNAEINYNLDDDIMKNPDVTSPKLKDVTQNGQKNVKIEFSEPAQIDGVSEDHQITPTEEQRRINNGKLSLPIIQFISEDNSKTIKGKVEKVDDHDTSIYVVPDGETLTAGTWKVVVRNVSDDVGNTAETLVKNNFVVEGGIPSVTDTGFRVRWIVAVPNGKTDPIAGGKAASDIIYIKFNRQIKTNSGAANAGATTNYTVNGYTLPTSKIDAFIDNYNKPASSYGYSDIVAIHLKATEATLTDKSNTININKTLESAAGVKLTVDNDGKYLLSKEDGTGNDINGKPNYIFTWKYNDYESGAETNDLKASDVQKLLDDENYNTFKFNTSKIDTTDLSKATINLTHSGTVDFGGLKVKELNINTMETGILNIKNVKADKVTVYAPYADVRLNGVKVLKGEGAAEGVGTLEVKDILAGTLTLSYGTEVSDLKVTDPNEGKIRLEGDAKVSKTFEIDTKGDITLDVDIKTDGKIPNVVDVKQACKIIVEYGTVKFKIADGVKGSDLEIISENGAKVTFEGKTPDGFKNDETTNTKVDLVGKVFQGSNKVEEDGTVTAEAKPATATYSVTAGKVDGVVTVKIDDGEGEAKTIGPVTVKATDSSKEIAEAIADEINKKEEGIGYTASPEDNKVIITASTSGKKDKFDVTFDFKSDKQQNKEAVTTEARKLAENVTSIVADGKTTSAEYISLKDVITEGEKVYKLSYELEDTDDFAINSNNVLTANKAVTDAKKLIVTVTYKGETAKVEFNLTSAKTEKDVTVTIAAIKKVTDEESQNAGNTNAGGSGSTPDSQGAENSGATGSATGTQTETTKATE